MKKLKLSLILSLTALLWSLMIVPVGTYLIMELYYLPNIRGAFSKVSEEKKTLFIKDLELIKDSGLVEKISRKNNAREFLNQYISWSAGRDDTRFNQEVKAYKIFSRHPWYLHHPKHFKNLQNDPELATIDLKWMNDLTQFDHWNIMDDPANRSFMEQAEAGNSIDRLTALANYSVPHSSNLLLFAILKLIQDHPKNPTVAYNKYLHTLKLIHSQHTRNSQISYGTGVIYGGQIQRFLPVKGFERLNDRVGVALRRTSWVWPTILESTWQGPVPEDIRKFMEPEFGVCAGARVNPLGINAFHELIKGPAWPLEHDFRAESQRSFELRKILFEKCDMPEFSFLLEKPGKTYQFENESESGRIIAMDPENSKIYIQLGQYPYFRRILFGMLSSIAPPHLFEIYEIQNPPHAK